MISHENNSREEGLFRIQNKNQKRERERERKRNGGELCEDEK